MPPREHEEKVPTEKTNEVPENCNTSDQVSDTGFDDSIYNVSPQRKRVIFTTMCLSVFICSLEMFIITTALPTIAKELNASDSAFAWIGAAYLLSFAALIPVWARLSDIFGRRTILGVTSGLFLLGTLIGALSQSSAMLVTARAMQGSGVGGLMVVINICVVHMYPPRERAFYFGIVGATNALAITLGPFVGGVLTEKLSWRYCFWIEVPITAISGLGMLVYYKSNDTDKTSLRDLRKIDWSGSITITGGTILFLIGLQFGVSEGDWRTPQVMCTLVFGILLFIIFFVIEGKVAEFPLIPLHFFTTLPRISVLVGCFSQALIMTATTYFIPLYFQTVLGTSPLFSGVYFLPTTLALAILWVTVGHGIKKTGHYAPIIRVGAAALLIGTGMLTDTRAYVSWSRIIISQIFLAIGFGCTYQAPLIALYEHIAMEDASAGTATYQFLKQFGQAISVVLGEVIMQGNIRSNSYKLAQAGTPAEVMDQLNNGQTIASIGDDTYLDEKQVKLLQEIFVDGFTRAWLFYAGIAGVAFVASFGIPMKKMAEADKDKSKPENEETTPRFNKEDVDDTEI